jgi:hypothetical protein
MEHWVMSKFSGQSSQRRECSSCFVEGFFTDCGIEFGNLCRLVADKFLHDGGRNARLFEQGDGCVTQAVKRKLRIIMTTGSPFARGGTVSL